MLIKQPPSSLRTNGGDNDTHNKKQPIQKKKGMHEMVSWPSEFYQILSGFYDELETISKFSSLLFK